MLILHFLLLFITYPPSISIHTYFCFSSSKSVYSFTSFNYLFPVNYFEVHAASFHVSFCFTNDFYIYYFIFPCLVLRFLVHSVRIIISRLPTVDFCCYCCFILFFKFFCVVLSCFKPVLPYPKSFPIFLYLLHFYNLPFHCFCQAFGFSSCFFVFIFQSYFAPLSFLRFL